MAILFDIDASPVNVSHIFRAVMGLYLAVVIFWVFGAFRAPLRLPALWSLTVFMLGLAAGRLLSLLVDGMPLPRFPAAAMGPSESSHVLRTGTP